MADNVIEVDFAAKLSPLQRVEEALRALAEMEVRSAAMEVRSAAAIRDDRRWRTWERRVLFARIRQLREELRAERANQFDDEAVYAAVVEEARETGCEVAAKALAARLLKHPTHSATVRVGLALSRLEAEGKVQRVAYPRSRTWRWRINA